MADPEVRPSQLGLIVRPGDTLIVAIDGDLLSEADAAEIKARIRERIPGLADVVIVASATALAAYRPG